jgi:hypothetical protein
MNRSQRLQRAADAKRVLENPMYKEAFEEVRGELLDRWENQPSTPETREANWMAIKLLAMLKAALEQRIVTGELEMKGNFMPEDKKRKGWL